MWEPPDPQRQEAVQAQFLRTLARRNSYVTYNAVIKKKKDKQDNYWMKGNTLYTKQLKETQSNISEHMIIRFRIGIHAKITF